MKFYEALIRILTDQGVSHLFGVPGDALNPLTDRLRQQEAIRWVRTAHEEGAAFAASGAAKLTGRLQVCAGTVGPGALHLINGLADAQRDGAPVLAIMGQIPRRFRGSDYHQELDLRGIFSSVLGHVVEVEDPRAAPHVFVEAINHAVAEREVAALIVSSEVGQASVANANLRAMKPGDLGVVHPPPGLIDEAVALLNGAATITIFAGEGSRGAESEVLGLAEKLRAPVIRSLKARDLYWDGHHLVCGELGVVGSRAAVDAMKQCEVLLMVGTDFPYRDWYNPDCHAIQIDSRASVIGRRSPRTLPLHADASVAVRELLERVHRREDDAQHGLLGRVWDHLGDEAEEPSAQADHLRPETLLNLLAEAAPDAAVFTCDTGTATVWVARHLHLRPGQRITFCANLGSMAYALPAAVGSALVEPERPVIAVTGDGAFNMLMGELSTAVAEKVPIKVVILNNAKVGLIALEQESEAYPEALTGQHNPDYVRFAEACGGAGFRIREPTEAEEVIRRFLDHEGPAVLDAPIDPDAIIVPPKVTLSEAWSFGLARAKELFGSSEASSS